MAVEKDRTLAPGTRRATVADISPRSSGMPLAGMSRRHVGVPRRCARAGTAAFLAGLLLVSAALATTPSLARETGERAVTPRGPLEAEERRSVELFQQVSPSVVHIETLEVGRRPFSRRAVEVQRGSGTGFIWDEAGHVVTNFHVISGGNAASVTLADHSSWRADLVGYSASRDLAVLRIRPDKGLTLRPIPLGTSADLLVGQHVFAIGNPYGLDQSMTSGVVSALEREIPTDNGETMRGLIQSDAAINPGNSGGPLLDSAGRLIGVNVAIFSPSGSSIGIGFSIPVDEVARIVPRLIRDGRFLRPSLGVDVAPPGFLAALSLEPGAAIIGVDDGGPAAKAGLEPFRRRRDGNIVAGDTIIALNGEPVRSNDELNAALETHQPGDRIRLEVRRQKKVRKLEMVLGGQE